MPQLRAARTQGSCVALSLEQTDAEIGYLRSQRLGRLATIQPDGSPQVKPVGFSYNADLGAALVVDDIVSTEPWRVRFLEIRGNAEAITAAAEGANDASVIRIHPTRILSFGIEESPAEPHQTRLTTRSLD